jgi:hypothetical protein
MKVFDGLLLAALLSGLASGLLFFGVIGVFVTVPAAFAIALVFGFPLYMVLRRLGWLFWWQVTLAGVACVAPVAVGLAIELPRPLYAVAATLVSGAFGGILFWWAALGPNNSFKPNPLRGSA